MIFLDVGMLMVELFYHKIIDTKNPKQGIIELRYIDPTKIRKVRQVKKAKSNKTGVDMIDALKSIIFIMKKVCSAGTGGGNSG